VLKTPLSFGALVSWPQPQVLNTVPPPIRHALATVTLGTTIEHRGLAVTALIGDDDPACDYLTVEEALAQGVVTIREVVGRRERASRVQPCGQARTVSILRPTRYRVKCPAGFSRWAEQFL